MKKKETWDSELSAFCAASARTPFKWGGNDCLSFALKAVEAMTGRVVWEHPQFPDAEGAERFLRAQGGIESLVERIAIGAGMREVQTPTRQCSRGDLALFQNSRRLCVGVVGIGKVLCPGPCGLKSAKLSAVTRGWTLTGEEDS